MKQITAAGTNLIKALIVIVFIHKNYKNTNLQRSLINLNNNNNNNNNKKIGHLPEEVTLSVIFHDEKVLPHLNYANNNNKMVFEYSVKLGTKSKIKKYKISYGTNAEIHYQITMQ